MPSPHQAGEERRDADASGPSSFSKTTLRKTNHEVAVMSMSQATQETDDALDQESIRRHEHAFLTEQLNETMPSRVVTCCFGCHVNDDRVGGQLRVPG